MNMSRIIRKIPWHLKSARYSCSFDPSYRVICYMCKQKEALLPNKL